MALLATGAMPAAEPPEAVTKILAAVGKADAAAFRAARARFTQLDPVDRRDPRTAYAWSLALAQHGQLAQAAKVLDALPAAAARSQPIRRVRLWLAVQLDRDEQIAELITGLVEGATRPDSGSAVERAETVRTLAGVLTLAEARADDQPPAETISAAAELLGAELPAELADEFRREAARVERLIDKRRDALQQADDAADERSAHDMQALADRVGQLQRQVDDAEATFHRDQPAAIADVRKRRKDLKAIESRLTALVAASRARGERPPREPQPVVDGKGQIVRYPSTGELLRYQDEVERWRARDRARIQNNAAAIAATREHLAAARDELDQAQHDLAAGGDALDDQKQELKKLKTALARLEQQRRPDGQAEALRPAALGLLPLAAEKERIIASYRRAAGAGGGRPRTAEDE